MIPMQEMRVLTTTCYTFAPWPRYLRLCPWPQFHQMLHLHILFARGASPWRLFLILPTVFGNVLWIVCCVPIHLGGFPLWSDTPVTPSHTLEIQDTMQWKKKKKIRSTEVNDHTQRGASDKVENAIASSSPIQVCRAMAGSPPFITVRTAA